MWLASVCSISLEHIVQFENSMKCSFSHHLPCIHIIAQFRFFARIPSIRRTVIMPFCIFARFGLVCLAFVPFLSLPCLLKSCKNDSNCSPPTQTWSTSYSTGFTNLFIHSLIQSFSRSLETSTCSMSTSINKFLSPKHCTHTHTLLSNKLFVLE